MNPISRVLVPIYQCRDTYPAFDHAVWFGKNFGSRLLIAAAIRKRQFMDSGVPSPTGAGGPFVDKVRLSKFRDALTEAAEGLVSTAKERGLDAQLAVTEGVFPEDIIALTRQSDLLIESALHRQTLIERWWDRSDLYADACCPTLVAHRGGLSLSSALIVYNGTKQASKVLRWVTRLAESGAIDTVAAVAIPRKSDGRRRLALEITAFAEAHGVEVQTGQAAGRDGFDEVVKMAKKMRPGFVAMPTYAFPRPFRLWLDGITAEALKQIGRPVLLFA